MLSSRLFAAASYARRGAFAADIGTDHAFLPIYLVSSGIARGALACDVNRGPLERARINIAAAGLSDRIGTCLTDGLQGLEASGAEDIFILGMGGELIARILSASALPRRPGVRLILQPMTHANDLRRMLARQGFRVIDERLVRDDLADKSGKTRLYQILCAEYDGICRIFTEAELWIGPQNIARHDENTREYAAYVCRVLQTRADGLASAGSDASAELAVIHDLEEIIHDCH